MDNTKRCFLCEGRLNSWNCNELQKRFTDGVQQYLCDVCADVANNALQKSRSFYGIDRTAYARALLKFKRKNGIPIFGRLNAMQTEMIEEKRKSLLRLMFWMDIRAVKKALYLGRKVLKASNSKDAG